METIEIQLNPQTLAYARQLAARRKRPLEKLIEEIIEQLSVAEGENVSATEAADDPILGIFADEPELMDKMLEDIMNSRQA